MTVLASAINGEDKKTQAEENQTLLNGNWVLTSGCEQDPSPSPTAWIIIKNNNVISCSQQSVTKGILIRTKNKGIYRIDWQKGPASTAEYPVTQWNLLGVTSQGSTNCYSRVRNPQNNPPQFCNK